MKNEHKPRPFMDYQSRVSGYREENGKYRGVIGCSYKDGSMSTTEYYDFPCDELRDSKEEAMRDTADLFHKLETTSPPTVAFAGQIYSLPNDEECKRAEKWLQENEQIALYFTQEFPGARLVNTTPLGGSTAKAL